MATETGTAARRVDRAAGSGERRKNALVCGLHPDFLRARIYDHAQVGSDPLALEDIGDDAQVVDVAVGARTDEDLIDLQIVARYIRNRMHVIGRMRAGDLRFKLADIDRNNALVDGIGIRPLDDERTIGPLFYVGYRLGVGVEDAVLGAGFDRHVGHRDAAGDRKLVNRRTVIFDRAIGRAVDSQLPDGSQHDVLGEDERARAFRCKPA